MITQNLGFNGSPSRVPGAIIHPNNDNEHKDVRSQLQRILSSPVFQNSKRYAAVLKYIVDRTLAGAGEQLKERTIGIEVFNRAPDYDTATDHAVRSAVAEIRKRLAQYYQENPRDALRIDVLPGSYIPQFRSIEEQRPLAAITALPSQAPTADTSKTSAAATRRPFFKFRWIVLACALLLGSLTAGHFILKPQSTLESFWGPILSSRSQVMLCIGNLEGGRGLPGGTSDSTSLNLSDFQNANSEVVNVRDAIAIAKFAGLMEANGKQFRIASQSDTTFTDLQNDPTILVGLLNNNWTERIVPKLRFDVEHPTSTLVTIRDRNNPSNNDWSLDYSAKYLDVTRDYALVLRMVDPKTEQMVVVAAGLTVFGTSAATDFLTNPNEIKKLNEFAPPGWEKKNMELVLSTDVIRGQSGPASIVASQFW